MARGTETFGEKFYPALGYITRPHRCTLCKERLNPVPAFSGSLEHAQSIRSGFIFPLNFTTTHQ
jgi:hypothetical protein